MFDSELDRDVYEPPHTEITLSNSVLLLIFFGAVIVCGVFFGFGYSMGRRSGAPVIAPETESSQGESPAAPAHPASKQSATGSSGAAQAAAESVPKTVTHAAVTADQAEAAGSVLNPAATARAKTSPASTTATAVRSVPAPTAAPASSAAAVPDAAGGKTWQVQVAAVTRQEDADALSNALRKKGYPVEIRPGSDKLFRVQMGPYTTQKQAADERDKLVNDGYMAIVK